MIRKCSRCGKPTGTSKLLFGENEVLCEACAEHLADEPVECPVCHSREDPDEAVAMLMTYATATPSERVNAKSVLVHVCPKCHVLFFDSFQYGIIKGLKQTGE